MKIAITQINPVIGDFKGNAAKIAVWAERARRQACDLVVFSELALTGYPPRDLLERDDFIEACQNGFAKLVASIDGIGVICGVIERNPAAHGNPLFNAAVLFEDGKILHTAHKRLLPTYDVFDERRYFEPGDVCEVFAYKGRRIGLTICEDMWNDTDFFVRRKYTIDPVKKLTANGADLLINISASPFHTGKPAFRARMLGAVARKYAVPLIYANQVGGNDSVLFDGHSMALDCQGEVRARALDFEEDLIVTTLQETGGIQGDMHPASGEEIEAIEKALIMGTRDYVRKCGFAKTVVGLSGGIDSALTAYVAVKALGAENVLTVFMPSRYTSRDNHEDTRMLADNLQIRLQTVPIDSMFDAFLKFISPAFEAHDPGITEQNIQARIRGTILMAFSNQQGRLVLTTGNKSELAVGYCTLYGDMNGGLAVISDLPKTTAYDLARYINRNREFIPQRIIDKAPSAELAPDQLDQDDLPPYDVLDPILTAYIEEARGVNEIARAGFDRRMVTDVIRRVDRNEYKRHQAAPGLKITSKAFGYGRRYPIAQRFSKFDGDV